MIKKMLPVVALSLTTQCAFAARYDPQDLAAILNEIEATGSAAVMVNLAPSSMNELFSGSSAAVERSRANAARLLEELDGHYWKEGKWENGLGQMQLYLQAKGLEKLMHSDNAVSFTVGSSWRERTLLSDLDQNLSRIENQLLNDGQAEVEIVLNIDGLDYRVTPQGKYKTTLAEKDDTAVANLRQAIAAHLPHERTDAAPVADGATMRLTITYPEFIELVQNENIRHLQPVGAEKSFSLHVDPQIQEFFAGASGDGTVDVLIEIRNPLAGGKLSPASFSRTRTVNERMLLEVFAQIGIEQIENLFASVGVAQVKLNRQQYFKLLSLEDKRIRSIGLNSAVGKPLLNLSTATLNVPLAWESGYRGAGQMVAVLDTGVQKSHEAFKDGNGNSRIIYEGCFGTNGSGLKSICPNQNFRGDSPFETPGAGSPGPVKAGENRMRAHGTHVAGIAVGSSVQYPGIAPEAQLVPIQVFSYQGAEPVTVFAADLLAAFEAGAWETQYSDNFPLTVTMSFGLETHAGNCDKASTAYSALSNYVNIFKSRQIPVVSATGNDGHRGRGLSFPSCIPNVIKVGSLDNDGTLQKISAFTNLANPANFTGPIFLAPGGGVTSPAADPDNDAAYDVRAGTSMAAPHVAGLYALAKSAMPDYSLDDLTAWINANFTETVHADLCSVLGGCRTEAFKAIKIK